MGKQYEILKEENVGKKYKDKYENIWIIQGSGNNLELLKDYNKSITEYFTLGIINNMEFTEIK